MPNKALLTTLVGAVIAVTIAAIVIVSTALGARWQRDAQDGPALVSASAASASANAPTASPAASASGDGGGGAAASLPDHTLTGYWQNFRNEAPPLRLRDVPRDYDVVAVAFATASAAPGSLEFGVDPDLGAALDGYGNAQFRQDVDALRQRGQHVILSIGGQNATVAVTDPASADRFAADAVTLMNRWGFEGIDIDLEHGIDPVAMERSLRAIHSAAPGTILTLAPQTLDMQEQTGTYLDLARRTRDIITTVHTQYYNSGSMLGCDGRVHEQGSVDFITAQACIARETGLRADQIAIGLPAAPTAAGSGWVSTSTTIAGLRCLANGDRCGTFEPAEAIRGVRGVMTWSINWDAMNGYAFARAVRPELDSLR